MARRTKLEGLDRTVATFVDLPDFVHAELAETIREGAEMIEGEARQRAPYLTGALVRSIRTWTRGDGLQASVGTNEVSGKFAEFGTKRQRARPWLFPAYQRGAKHLRSEWRDMMRDVGKARFKSRRFRGNA